MEQHHPNTNSECSKVQTCNTAFEDATSNHKRDRTFTTTKICHHSNIEKYPNKQYNGMEINWRWMSAGTVHGAGNLATPTKFSKHRRFWMDVCFYGSCSCSHPMTNIVRRRNSLIVKTHSKRLRTRASKLTQLINILLRTYQSSTTYRTRKSENKRHSCISSITLISNPERVCKITRQCILGPSKIPSVGNASGLKPP
eukprot:4697299-Amphidinium_carterae.1